MAVIPKAKRSCWDCNGTGMQMAWIDGRKVEVTCRTCGGTGEK